MSSLAKMTTSSDQSEFNEMSQCKMLSELDMEKDYLRDQTN